MQKRKRRSEGGWWKQTDVAGRLKCSSRDLPLEFAGNRTGLLGAGWGGGWCVGVCVCLGLWLYATFMRLCVYVFAFAQAHGCLYVFMCVVIYLCFCVRVCVCDEDIGLE